MGPIEAVRTGYRRTFTYSGRATRSEFWWFAACCIFILSNVLAYGLGSIAPITVVFIAQVALIAVPLSACLTRRMRDAGRHPLWAAAPVALLLVDPLIGLLGLGEEFAHFSESDDDMPGAGIIVMGTIAILTTFASIPTLVFCFLGSAPGSDKSQSSQEPKTE